MPALPPWVIVQTKPSAEHVVERGLRGWGYRTYLPHYRKLLNPHGRLRQPTGGMRPLFPSLLFAQDWRGWPAISIAGVVGLMLVRSVPATLSDDDVSLIMERERSGEFDELKYPKGSGVEIRTDIQPGENIEIVAYGTRVLGVLDELSEDGKAIVSAMIFGRMVRVTVDDPAVLQRIQR